MYNYTTPTITVTMAGVVFADVNYVRLALVGENASLLREIPASDFGEKGQAYVSLTQEETAAFGEGNVYIQARIIYQDGTIQPTNKVTAKMRDILDKVVI